MGKQLTENAKQTGTYTKLGSQLKKSRFSAGAKVAAEPVGNCKMLGAMLNNSWCRRITTSLALGILLYATIGGLLLLYTIWISRGHVAISGPNFKHIILALIYAPIFENAAIVLIVYLTTSSISLAQFIFSKLLDKPNSIKSFNLRRPSFFISIPIVYFFGVTIHGYPTGPFLGILFVFLAFFAFPARAKLFSWPGFLNSALTHFSYNACSMVFGEVYLMTLLRLVGK